MIYLGMHDYNIFLRVLAKITFNVNVRFNNFENKDLILILIFLNASFFSLSSLILSIYSLSAET